MFKHYFRTAWRNIIRNKAITLINLFSLSVALAVFILIAFWVHNELSFDNYHKGAQDIYLSEVRNSPEDEPGPITVLPLADLLKSNPHVKYAARMAFAGGVLKVGDQLWKQEYGAAVDSEWFKIFDYQVVYGDLASFNRNAHSLIFTESRAKQLFGKKNAVGQIVQMDTTLYQVRAIVKDNPINSSLQFKMFMPMSARLSEPGRMERDYNWHNASYRTFIKLSPNTNISDFTAKMTTATRKASENNGSSLFLEPLKELHFDIESFDGEFHLGNRTMVFIFGALGILLLIIASINYVNLSIAKANTRTKEISIRKITGGTRWQLFLQFLLESFLLCLMALVLAILIMYLALPVFNRLTDTNFELSLTSPLMWYILLSTLALTALLNGVFPALTIAFFKPLSFLQGHTILKYKNILVRKGLVIFQFVVGVVFIVGTIVIYLQMNLARTSAAQYQREQVVSLNLPSLTLKEMDYDAQKVFRLCQTIKHDLEKHNFIQEVAFGESPIEGQMNSSGAQNFYWQGGDTSFHFRMTKLFITPNAIKIFNFHLKDGHWFSNENVDRKNFILNEIAVRKMGLHEPVVGQFFGFNGGDTGQIIGVIKDYNFTSLYDKIQPMVIGSSTGELYNHVFVKIASGKIGQAMKVIKDTWKRFIPDAPITYEFMDQAFDNIYKRDLRISTLIFGFSCITIIISLAGLFGLAAFISEQRVREIGIRKVFGASVKNIMLLLSYGFIKLVFIAVIIAIPIAWWLSNKWLSNFAYKIHLNLLIFLSAGVLVLLIALFTISAQTVRAARANPVDSLKME